MARFGEVDYSGLNSVVNSLKALGDNYFKTQQMIRSHQEEQADKRKAAEMTNMWADTLKGADEITPDLLFNSAVDARRGSVAGGPYAQSAAKQIYGDVDLYTKLNPRKIDQSMDKFEFYLRAAGGDIAKARELMNKDVTDQMAATQKAMEDRQLGVQAAKPPTTNVNIIQGIGADGQPTVSVVNTPKVPGGKPVVTPTGVQPIPKTGGGGGGGTGKYSTPAEIDALEAMFNAYTKELKDVPTGKLSGTLSVVIGKLGVDTKSGNAAEVAGSMKGIVGRRIARVVGGEVGVMTDRDAAVGESVLPLPTDNSKVRVKKEKMLRSLIQVRRQAVQNGFRGRIVLDGGRFRPEKYTDNTAEKMPTPPSGLDMEDMQAYFDRVGLWPKSEDEVKQLLGMK